MTAAKQQLRQRIRNIRDSIPDHVASVATDAATRRLLAHPLAFHPGVVAIYASMPGELGTAALASELSRRGATLVYPRVNRDARQLSFHRVEDASDLCPGVLGILEPAADAPRVLTERIDWFLVPGLAFDRAGHRLGYGKGYYDRALAKNPRAARIGYGFECQVVDDVPLLDWDVPMTHVVTEAGVRVCRRPLQQPGA